MHVLQTLVTGLGEISEVSDLNYILALDGYTL